MTHRQFIVTSGAATLGVVGLRTYPGTARSPLRARGYGDLLSDANRLKVLAYRHRS